MQYNHSHYFVRKAKNIIWCEYVRLFTYYFISILAKDSSQSEISNNYTFIDNKT